MRDSKAVDGPDGIRITNGPCDVFKILNGAFDTYNKCNHLEIAFGLLRVIGEILSYYQTNLELMIVNLDFTPGMYIGFCNDALIYKKCLEDFIEKVEKLTNLEVEVIEEVICLLFTCTNFLFIVLSL